jgi:hypothetical protein
VATVRTAHPTGQLEPFPDVCRSIGSHGQFADQQRFTKIEFSERGDLKPAHQGHQFLFGKRLVFLPIAGQHLERVGEALRVHRAGASVIVLDREGHAGQGLPIGLSVAAFDAVLMQLRPTCHEALDAGGKGRIVCVWGVPREEFKGGVEVAIEHGRLHEGECSDLHLSKLLHDQYLSRVKNSHGT